MSLDANRPAAAFWIVLGVIEASALLLHLPSLRSPHIEGDEVIFTFLAERLAGNPLQYNLRGTLEGEPARRFIADTWVPLYLMRLSGGEQERVGRQLAVLERADVLRGPFSEGTSYAYDPEIYDRPIFFHPPLYPYTAAFFRAIMPDGGGPLLSIMLHGSTILLTGLLGRLWGAPPVGLLAAALVAIDPVSWFCGSRLWIDGMFQTMVTASVMAACCASRSRRICPFVLAGLIFGLACLTKLPAVAVFPAVLLAWLMSPLRPSQKQVLMYALSAAFVVVPWLVFTRIYYGAWLPKVFPTPWQIEQYPYVRQTVGRPWHFYLWGLLLCAPVFAYSLSGLASIRSQRWILIPSVWAAVVVGAMTVAGAFGLGFQLRYLAPAMPALSLVTAAGIAYLPRWWSAPAMVLAAATFCASIYSAAQPARAEPLPLVLAWLLSQTGYHILPP